VKGLGSCDKVKKGVCAKKEKGIFIVERRERESISICGRSVEKGIHSTLKITPDITSTSCGKKRWNTKNGTKLSSHKPVDDKEWILFTPYCRHTG